LEWRVKRKPSAKVLSKGLWRAAHNAEALANRLRELGDDSQARAVAAAANAMSSAAIAVEKRLS
jgi:hypothetical protein